MFRRELDSGVVVEVNNEDTDVEITLIEVDHIAGWIISYEEAQAIWEGLNVVLGVI